MMIDFVASDLEVDLEEKALKLMWKICAANQAEHKLLWSDQAEKPETLDRWSMRLQTVLQFIQPRLAMLKKMEHFPDDEDLAQVMCMKELLCSCLFARFNNL